MADAAAGDAVWLDVLPSMKGFGPALAKGAQGEADKVGKSTGKKFGLALLAGTAAVAGGAALATKALYNIGATFDEVSDTIRVGTGATGDALAALEESAKRVGMNVPAEFEAIGTVVADVNTRLGLTGPTLEKFSSQVLEATRIMGEEIDINAMSAAFNVFQIEGEDATEAMDHLFRVSQATGVGMNELATNAATAAPAMQALGFSFEETTALVGNLDKAGLNSSKMMAGMSRALVELAKDGEEPAEAFERTTGEIQAFLDQGDKAAAIDLASQLFGTRNASQFIGALETGALSMEELGAVAGMTEDTILGAGRETMDFAEQWQLFKNQVLIALEPLASRVFAAFGKGMEWVNTTGIPAIKSFADWLGPKLQGPLAWLRDVGAKVFGEIEGSIRAFAAAWVYNDGEVTSSGLPGVMERVGYAARQTFDYVKDTVIPALSSFAGWIYDNRSQLSILIPMILGAFAALKTMMFIKTVTVAVRAFSAALIANPIGIVIAAIGALVGALVWLYYNNETARVIMDAAWAGIKSAISAVVTWFKDTAWPWMKGVFDAIGAVVMWLWGTIYKPYFTLIWDILKAVGGWVKDTLWPWMRDAFAQIGDRAGVVRDAITGAWGTIKDGISSGWDFIKGVFDKFKAGLSSLRDRFSSVKDGIASTWSTLTDAIAGPIRAVVQFVNDKFLGPLEKALNLIPGVDIEIPRIPVPGSPPRVYTPAQQTYGQSYGGGVGGYADGGTVRGWSPHARADNIPAMLTAGEYVLPVAATRRLMGRFGPGFMESLRQGLPGYADGGMVGGPVGDALAGAGRWIWDLFSDPGKAIGGLFDRLLGGLADSLPAQVVVGAAKSAATGVADWVRGLFGGGDEPGGSAGPAMPWQAIWGLIQAVIPGARKTSDVRPGARTAGYGTTSLHALGRAVDFVSPNMVAATQLLSMMRGWTELIHTPAGMFQQSMGRRFSNFAPITKQMHYDHVHVGMADGGLVKPLLFDQGGYLPRGLSMVQNNTGKPEPLMRMDKPMRIEGRLRIDGDGFGTLVDARIAADHDHARYESRMVSH